MQGGQHGQDEDRHHRPEGGHVALLDVAAAGEEEDRKLASASGERVLERQAIQTRHGQVEEQDVGFERLGLVVVDEQHRFGVMQRLALIAKGRRPDVLVMTATPIPRTLALAFYGDLDQSKIDELPPGRTPVETKVIRDAQRARAYDLARRELDTGRQAYVVYPLVEESEKTDLTDATSGAAELARVFAPHRVGLVHGQLKADEKEAMMAAFRAGEIAVLVATTVIEVGVDVPNASLMVIEHAERFGLAQLHQLRGRIGRGARESVCILLYAAPLSATARAAALRGAREAQRTFDPARAIVSGSAQRSRVRRKRCVRGEAAEVGTAVTAQQRLGVVTSPTKFASAGPASTDDTTIRTSSAGRFIFWIATEVAGC